MQVEKTIAIKQFKQSANKTYYPSLTLPLDINKIYLLLNPPTSVLRNKFYELGVVNSYERVVN